MENQKNPYATAYARKILNPKGENVKASKKVVPTRRRPKPIDKHGDYAGTDVGFTSNSIEKPIKKQTAQKNPKKPIDQHGNYDGTDVGFTSSSFSEQTIKD